MWQSDSHTTCSCLLHYSKWSNVTAYCSLNTIDIYFCWNTNVGNVQYGDDVNMCHDVTRSLHIFHLIYILKCSVIHLIMTQHILFGTCGNDYATNKPNHVLHNILKTLQEMKAWEHEWNVTWVFAVGTQRGWTACIWLFSFGYILALGSYPALSGRVWF